MDADGAKFPIEFTLARVDGRPPLVVGFMREIRERALERREREIEERRRAALTALGHQVLRNAPLDEIGIAVAVLAREELGVDVARIWQPAPRTTSPRSWSPRPGRPTRPGTGRRRCPRSRPARSSYPTGSSSA